MIHLIIGRKGSGKTKRLIQLVNDASAQSAGNVVCLEKEPLLTYDVHSRVRLINTDHFNVRGFSELYGFISGICARDYDITDMFVDRTLKIGNGSMEELAVFLKKIAALCTVTSKEITFTLSADAEELPKEIFAYCDII